MTKNPRLRGWNLTKDELWKERLKEIRTSRPELTNPMAPTPHKETLPSPITECDPDCPICHGKAFYVDSQEFAIECPNARRKLNGGD